MKIPHWFGLFSIAFCICPFSWPILVFASARLEIKVRVCWIWMIEANWLNPARQKCGNKDSSFASCPIFTSLWSLAKGTTKRTISKQKNGHIVQTNWGKKMPFRPFVSRAKINPTKSGWLDCCQQGQDHRWMGWGSSHVWHCSSVSQT